MPKLPDSRALGLSQGDLPQATRHITSYSAQGFNYTGPRGGEAIQRGLERLGAGVDQFIGSQQAKAKEEEAKANALQLAEANGNWSVAVDKIYAEKGQQDDYNAAPNDFREAAQPALQSIANGIADPYRKAMFLAHNAPTIEHRAIGLENHARGLRRSDYNIERDNLNEEQLQQALANPDPAYRSQKLKEVTEDIEGRRQAGYLTANEARAKNRQFVDKYSKAYGIDWVKRDPEGLLKETEEVAPAEGLRIRGVPPGESRVIQNPQGTRRQPITATLEKQLNAGASAAGVQVEVYSGGQPSSGPNRTGSHRHDLGNAADLKLFEVGEDGSKRYLSSQDPKDRARMAQFITASVAAGATGVGHGKGESYMGSESIHVGGGGPITWGAGGSHANAPAWVNDAWEAGRKGGGAQQAQQAQQPQQEAATAPREYAGLTLPLNVPSMGRGMVQERITQAGLTVKDLPDSLQQKFSSGGGFSVTKEDLDAIPDATWRKLAPQFGLKAPPEKKTAAAAAAVPTVAGLAQVEQSQGDGASLPQGAQYAQTGGAPAPGARRRTGTPLDYLSPTDLIQLRSQAQTEMARRRGDASKAREEQFDRVIIDAKADRGQLPPREAIENDPNLTEGHRNVLLGKYDTAAKAIDKSTLAMRWFMHPNALPLNPYDKEQRDVAEQAYQRLGGNEAALQAVIDKGQVLPQSVGVGLRGALISSDPTKVQGSLTVASNLQARIPNIFTKVEGEKEITDAVNFFRHNVDDLGFTALEAAARYTERQTPEYQSKVKARMKGEDLNDAGNLSSEFIKKNLAADELAKKFDNTKFWQSKPTVGVDREQRNLMFKDYVELVEENYLSGPSIGDIAAAKKNAISQLGKVYGVSNVSGSPVLMKFAPELAPAYRNIQNASDLIANQAIMGVLAETGQTVTRDKLIFMPIPGGRTSTAFWNGEPPPYMVGWRDKNGVADWAPRPFVADLKADAAAQAEKRALDFQQRQDTQQQMNVLTAPRPPGERRTGRPTMPMIQEALPDAVR